MKRAALLCLCFVISLAVAAEAFVPLAHAQSSSGEIVVAQNNDGPGGFFRRLFGGNRRQQRAPRREPLDLFPGFDGGQEQQQAKPKARKQRKARTAAPKPREVAAVEKAPNAKRALVIGDFMAGALAKGLADAFRENANVVVVDASSGSSGLVREDYFNWPVKLPEMVTEQKPDAILVMIGGNDRQTMRTEAGSQAFGTDVWRAAYTARVIALADALKATGKPAFWGGLVPVAPSAMSRDYSSLNGIFREQAEAKGLKFVDMWNGFADEEGKYVGFGPDVRGQAVQLRADDGLNFTRAGQRKLAYFMEQDLNDVFGGAAPILTAVRPTVVAPGGLTEPLIGPMVPLDALSLMGGDALSGGVPEGQRGNVATAISAKISKADAPRPPAARADSYIWPVVPAAVPVPAAASASPPPMVPARGPR